MFKILLIFKLLLALSKWKKIFFNIEKNFINFFFFLPTFFKLNSLILNEGLLIDYLQKLSLQKYISYSLINASFLFNEILVFDRLVFFVIDLFLYYFNSKVILNFFSSNFIFFTFYCIFSFVIFFFIVIFFLIF